MTRALFSLTCIATALVALTTIVIRWELARSGVTFFLTSDGQPNGHLFNEAVRAHTLLCHLAVLLLGTTMSAAAAEKGAPLARIFAWLGVILANVLTLTAVLAVLPPFGGSNATPDTGVGVGWTLYPPLATYPFSLLQQLVPQLDPFLMGYFTSLSALPANAMLYLGAYAMAATLPQMRWLSYAGLVTVIAALVLTTRTMRTVDVPYEGAWIAALVVPFLAAAIYQLRNQRASWLTVLTFGMLIATLTPAYLVNSVYMPVLRGTTSMAALQYMFPMGLAWFALPALMLYRTPTRLPVCAIRTLLVAVTSGLAIWLLPLFQTGRLGQAARYVDYPPLLEPANMIVSIGVTLFAVLYLATLIILHRAKAKA